MCAKLRIDAGEQKDRGGGDGVYRGQTSLKQELEKKIAWKF